MSSSHPHTLVVKLRHLLLACPAVLKSLVFLTFASASATIFGLVPHDDKT